MFSAHQFSSKSQFDHFYEVPAVMCILIENAIGVHWILCRLGKEGDPTWILCWK